MQRKIRQDSPFSENRLPRGVPKGHLARWPGLRCCPGCSILSGMNTHRCTVTLVALLIALLGLLAMNDGRYLALFRDLERVREWVQLWGAWAPVAIVLLQIAQVLLAPVPGHVVGLASGYLFGAVWGAFYSVLGTTLGSLMAFVLARTLGRPLVERLLSEETLARLDAGAQRRGLFFFVLLFLLPFVPDDMACLAAGLTPIPIPALMLAVLAGRPPGILVSSWLGANAAGLSTSQWALLIAASALLALLFLLHGQQLEEWTMRLVERLTS
jgi:uncharacterized membrane protein YdjX (TVP38/TMEM64 family)